MLGDPFSQGLTARLETETTLAQKLAQEATKFAREAIQSLAFWSWAISNGATSSPRCKLCAMQPRVFSRRMMKSKGRLRSREES